MGSGVPVQRPEQEGKLLNRKKLLTEPEWLLHLLTHLDLVTHSFSGDELTDQVHNAAPRRGIREKINVTDEDTAELRSTGL